MSSFKKICGFLTISGVALFAASSGAQEVGIQLAQVDPVGSPCYAVFHEGRDGQGASLERIGPEDVPRIRELHYSDGRDLNRRVLSVTTGPAAKLVLYDGSRYVFPMLEALPNSRVNLALPVMDSYQLRCVGGPPQSPQFK